MLSIFVKTLLLFVMFIASSGAQATEKVVTCAKGEQPTGCRAQGLQCVRGKELPPAESCQRTIAQNICPQTFGWESCCLRLCSRKHRVGKAYQECLDECNEMPETRIRR